MIVLSRKAVDKLCYTGESNLRICLRVPANAILA